MTYCTGKFKDLDRLLDRILKKLENCTENSYFVEPTAVGRPTCKCITNRGQLLLCKLLEHFALAQRSRAPKRSSERRRASKIKNFMISIIFMILGSLMTVSINREKWYPEYFNLNEALHVPRLNISSDRNSRLLENEFRDFEKLRKMMVKTRGGR